MQYQFLFKIVKKICEKRIWGKKLGKFFLSCFIILIKVLPIEPVEPNIAIFFFICNLNFTKSKIRIHESKLDKLLEMQKSFHLYDLKFLHDLELNFPYLVF